MKSLKKTAMFLLLVCVAAIGILLSTTVTAEAATNRRVIASGTCGEKLTWTIDYDPASMDAALRISGTGEMNDYHYYYDSMMPPWSKVSWEWEDEETMTPTELAHCLVKEIIVEKGVTSIGAYAFAYIPPQSMIEKITIADTVTSIGDYAFNYYFDGVDTFTIPKGVQHIGLYALSFDKLQVHPNNKYFSHDAFGCLYDKKKTKLIHVPDSLEGAFVIPDTVCVIGKEAFWNSDVTEVTIPDTVKTIEYRNFSNTNLTDVHYGGVELEWDRVEVDWGNIDLLNATIHYADKIIAVINSQPVSQCVPYGETALFSIAADHVVSYQWQYSRNGTDWYQTGLSGNKTNTLSVNMVASRNHCQYRCRLTSVDGVVSYTEPATLTMDANVGISSMPTNQISLEGSKAQFTVSATDIRSYRWYYRRNAEDSWHATAMTGYVTDTLTVLAKANRNGYQYRCRLIGIDGSEMFTDPATLTITSCIISQPEKQCVAAGETAQFTVVAENVTSYQWLYRRSAENGWSNTGATGNKTSQLSVPMMVARNGYQYMCKLINNDGSILYTDVVTLYLRPTVTKQPEDLTVAAGQTAQFKVTADGVVSYQWQYARPGSNSWSSTSAAGNKTDTLSVTAKSTNSGYRYRCKLVGTDGTVVFTDPATMTVE